MKLFRSTIFVLAILSLNGLARTGPARADSLEKQFEKARNSYRAMLSIPRNEQKPAAWKECIRQLQQVLDSDKQGKYVDKCYYLIAQSHHRLYDNNQDRKDLKAALTNYKTLVYKYPESPLADDAQYLVGIIYLEEDPTQAYLEFVKVGIFFPKGDMQTKAAQRAEELKQKLGCGTDRTKDGAARQASNATAAGPASVAGPASDSASSPAGVAAAPAAGVTATCPKLIQLENVKHWSGEKYTRVVLYLSEPAKYEQHNLPAEPKIGLPARIYLDLKNCVVSSNLKPKIPIKDRFLQRVRVAQYDATRARVVLDIESMESHKIFSLADPFRLVIDVKGTTPAPPKLSKQKSRSGKGAPLPSLAQQLGLGVKRIVLDPGHGGKDKGAISPSNVYEKDIVLAIAKQLKKTLEKATNCEVILTRTRDRFLSLEERTAIANVKKADLFISIHTNAHEDQNLHGIETYFLNLSKDKESARVAALENATSTKKISDLEAILSDLMLNTKINESSRLAGEVQRNIIRSVKSGYSEVRDLGVKQAPFYVLLGAEMPSILVETAFITNKREESLLQDRGFREDLSTGIAAGIGSYIRHMKQFAQAGEQQ